MSEQQAQATPPAPVAPARMQIKASVLEVLTPVEGVILREALDRLAGCPLDAAPRWRVNQIEHVLCEKETAKGLDEP